MKSTAANRSNLCAGDLGDLAQEPQLQSRLRSFHFVSSSAPQSPPLPQTQCYGENSGRMSGRVSIRSCPLSCSFTGSNVTRLESPSRVNCRAASGFTPPLPGRERGRETLVVVGVPDRFLDRTSREPAVVVGKLRHRDKITFSGHFKYNLRTLPKW